MADLAALGDGADVVIVCVFTDEQVQQVCLEGDLVSAMAPGAVLVIHTTGSPRTAEAIAAHARGIDVVDAPVSGGPHDIAAGNVTLFVGGDDDAVARVKPVLAAYADPILHVGRTGAGQLVKLINNTLFAAQIGLVAEGVRLGGRLGVDEAALLEALTHGSATAWRWARSRRRAPRRPSSTRSATSSARTSQWSARPSPTWAAISARSMTSSTPGSGHVVDAIRVLEHPLVTALL